MINTEIFLFTIWLGGGEVLRTIKFLLKYSKMNSVIIVRYNYEAPTGCQTAIYLDNLIQVFSLFSQP